VFKRTMFVKYLNSAHKFLVNFVLCIVSIKEKFLENTNLWNDRASSGI